METPATIGDTRDRASVAAVLLLLQSGVAALSALGAIVLAVYDHAPLSGGRALALVSPPLWCLLGLAIAGRRRWARVGALWLEVLVLLASVFGRLLPAAPLGLAGLLTAFALPGAVLWLLLAPFAERGDARRRAERTAARASD